MTYQHTWMEDKALAWMKGKVGRWQYSQPKRKQDGYIDCSSGVARGYISAGFTWSCEGAPIPRSLQEVYDDCFELVWPKAYADIGKHMGGRDVIRMAMQPGNLQYLCTDSDTHRANRITHVAMVASDKLIVHARGTKWGVRFDDICLYDDKVCAVSRFNPRCTLRRGMRGQRVMALQDVLADDGYKLTADGVFGARTEDALRDYQLAHGLIVSGMGDDDTRKALGLTDPYADAYDDAPDVQPAGPCVRITGDSVNLRVGPGTYYDVAAIAHAGDTLSLEENANGWRAVRVDGRVLWVSPKYSTVG